MSPRLLIPRFERVVDHYADRSEAIAALTPGRSLLSLLLEGATGCSTYLVTRIDETGAWGRLIRSTVEAR